MYLPLSGDNISKVIELLDPKGVLGSVESLEYFEGPERTLVMARGNDTAAFLEQLPAGQTAVYHVDKDGNSTSIQTNVVSALKEIGLLLRCGSEPVIAKNSLPYRPSGSKDSKSAFWILGL